MYNRQAILCYTIGKLAVLYENLNSLNCHILLDLHLSLAGLHSNKKQRCIILLYPECDMNLVRNAHSLSHLQPAIILPLICMQTMGLVPKVHLYSKIA